MFILMLMWLTLRIERSYRINVVSDVVKGDGGVLLPAILGPDSALVLVEGVRLRPSSP